jgi:hypothetical protein
VEAAAPPLISRCAAQGTGPPLRPQGCCASLTRRPCGPALTPETTAAPSGRKRGQARPAPPGMRHTTKPAQPIKITNHDHYNGSLYGSRGLPGSFPASLTSGALVSPLSLELASLGSAPGNRGPHSLGWSRASRRGRRYRSTHQSLGDVLAFPEPAKLLIKARDGGRVVVNSCIMAKLAP